MLIGRVCKCMHTALCLILQGMHTQNQEPSMMKYHSTPLRVTITKRNVGKILLRMSTNWNPCALLLEMKIEITLWETNWWFFTTLNVKLSYDQAILHLNIYSKEWKEKTQVSSRYLHISIPRAIVQNSKSGSANCLWPLIGWAKYGFYPQ